MIPIGNSTASFSGLLQWNSPLPYVFGVLAILFGIIAVALLFLACSHQRSSPEFPNGKEEKYKETIQASASMEPKIVVIMAGDDHPRYIANPCPWIRPCSTFSRSLLIFLFCKGTSLEPTYVQIESLAALHDMDLFLALFIMDVEPALNLLILQSYISSQAVRLDAVLTQNLRSWERVFMLSNHHLDVYP